jgi:hypothetical protein
MRKAIGGKLLGDICLHCLNDLMCSIAILLWISAVTALASAHEILSSLLGARNRKSDDQAQLTLRLLFLNA